MPTKNGSVLTLRTQLWSLVDNFPNIISFQKLALTSEIKTGSWENEATLISGIHKISANF